MELNKIQRLILYNQYQILKHLEPEEKETYEISQKILHNGFKYDYDELTSFFNEEIPEEISEFVYDVLQMYRCINDSYGDLSNEEKEGFKKLNTTFGGFDGNEEPKYYSYACFLLEDLEKFEESYNNGKISPNSHRNMLKKYEKMLSKWEEVRNGRYDSLTLEQIKYITSY
ncbi:YfbU family protein [Clostridium cagae]|uniref:YfbU family protein n=1 Tax=Clostridium botulinum TaxID=1491 RepID=A0A6B4JKL2_CLOBO|nr:YfbU family protein [Clostridium botulinum]EES50529.1 YfbU domain superfamily [Clostridium botulinum E1 str. 'BoNT E Beluga']MBY6760791.1 YfbU family protein [Clostridium botulinum]MBY6919917.1 YfbU family protein [Clostridium botulinum]MCR1130577.1 YfbU family protein [Clostridium botulinum]NFJ57479.1 YfbU family protein [Clostridium botulinum]